MLHTNHKITVYVLDPFGDYGTYMEDVGFNVIESTNIRNEKLSKLYREILQNSDIYIENNEKIKTFKAFNPEYAFKVYNGEKYVYYYISFYDNEVMTSESNKRFKIEEKHLNELEKLL